MTSDATKMPGRPWWRRKRWAAAGLLWLVVAYPLSVWPAAYAAGRGWLPEAQMKAIYAPALSAAEALRPQPRFGQSHTVDGMTPIVVIPDPDPPPWPIGAAADGYFQFAEWFWGLGSRHAGAD